MIDGYYYVRVKAYRVFLQASCESSNTLHTMRMTSLKCVLQQRHLLGYESEPDP